MNDGPISLIPVQKCYLGPTMKSQYYKLYSESTSSPLLQRHKIIRCGSSSLDPEFPKKGETERASSFSTRLKKKKNLGLGVVESMSGLNRSSSVPFKNGGLPPQELLDDLCSRLVLNVPKEDQQSFERILFLVENAHWFYEDNSVEKNPSLKSFTLKEFTSLSIFFYI